MIFLASLRIHVFISLMLAGIIPILILAFGMLNTYHSNSIQMKINEVQDYGKKIAARMLINDYLANPSINTDIISELSLVAGIYGGRILVINNSLKIITDTYDKETNKTLISKEAVSALRGKGSVNEYKQGKYAEIAIPVEEKETNSVIGAVILVLSLDKEYLMYQKLEQMFYLITVFICIALVIAAFLYSRKLTKPLLQITSSINHVSEGYMDDEVSVKGYKEIVQISNSVNEMLSHMKTLEESRQEFVSNVSHELKTPITSIKVLADSLVTQEDAPVEIYREFMTDIKDEIERENKIINDLLSLVKMDKKSGEMHIAETSINELLEIILKRIKPIALLRNIELVFESFRPVLAEIDEVKMSLAVSNLIENAVKYNMDDGWVRVSLNADHKYFYVTVADSGMGIPENEQSHIFDRFYRVDKARSRQTGGTGLGLSITKNVILMHKGAIKVYSRENEGTTFTIRVPLSFIA